MVTFVYHGSVNLNPDCRNVICFIGLDHLVWINQPCSRAASGWIHFHSVMCMQHFRTTFPMTRLSTDSAKQSTGIWNRSNTKTIERADFDLLTRQRNLATFIEICDLFCRKFWSYANTKECIHPNNYEGKQV